MRSFSHHRFLLWFLSCSVEKSILKKKFLDWLYLHYKHWLSKNVIYFWVFTKNIVRGYDWLILQLYVGGCVENRELGTEECLLILSHANYWLNWFELKVDSRSHYFKFSMLTIKKIPAKIMAELPGESVFAFLFSKNAYAFLIVQFYSFRGLFSQSVRIDFSIP